MEKINIELAGIPLELTLRYKMFRDRYADFQTEKKPCACIEITPEQCACAARGYEPGTLPESVEDLELCTKACAALLPHGRQSFMRFASCGAERHGSSALRAEWEKQRIISSGNAFSRMKWKC